MEKKQWTNFLGLAGSRLFLLLLRAALTSCVAVVFAVMIPVALRYAWKKEITQAADTPEVYDESYASSSASLLVTDDNEMVSSSRRRTAEARK